MINDFFGVNLSHTAISAADSLCVSIRKIAYVTTDAWVVGREIVALDEGVISR
jgi:hypothetical protein